MSKERDAAPVDSPNSEATSGETLAEIEENESVDSSDNAAPSPSPDGQFDDPSGGGAKDNPHPM